MNNKIENTLARIAAKESALENCFTCVFDQSKKTAQPTIESKINNKIFSIKNLLDVKGYVTSAGSILFDQPAKQDSDVVKKIRAAGGLIFAHTNMTELAYSGLGLNPHYGTPKNALNPAWIPGGSTSGGAVSVATNAVDIAIGTDTGGSLRIPAAFNGLVGFKPSQNTVSVKGCRPLSHSLDSIGPIATNVQDCFNTWLCIHNNPSDTHHSALDGSLDHSFVIAENFGMSDLDPIIEEAFNSCINILANQNITINTARYNFIEDYKALNSWHLTSVECASHYQIQINTQANLFDPRVISRIEKSNSLSATQYCQTLLQRQQLINNTDLELDNKILIMPTVAIMPPKLSDLIDDDEKYFAANLLCLRNTSLANGINGCSISIPFHYKEHLIGIMLTAKNGQDIALLNAAMLLEKCFRTMNNNSSKE